MCIFKVIHSIFETSKTLEKKKERKKERTELFTTMKIKI